MPPRCSRSSHLLRCQVARAWLPGSNSRRRAGVGVEVIVPVAAGTNQDDIRAKGHAAAELVAICSVGCQQPGLLRPDIAVTAEEVGGAGAHAKVFVPIGAHHGQVAQKCHTATETCPVRAVRRQELGLLHPCAGLVTKDISGAGIFARGAHND